MTDGITVYRVDSIDTLDLHALVRESVREGYRHLERMEQEQQNGTNRFELEGEALFAARDGSELAAVCGLNVDPYQEDPLVGRVRRMYVLPPYRRLGVGRLLTEQVIQAAKGHFHTLVLRTNNPAASEFYERLGFLPGEKYPESTHYMELRK